jgi:hypothetical protein
MTTNQSLRTWLRGEILAVLDRKTGTPPLLVWCDPFRAWRELLLAAAEGDAFELWAGGEHELLLRERLSASPAKPRVLWLPVSGEEIEYLKVFEIQADQVWTETLVAGLARYGVELSRDTEAELRLLLPAHAKEWIDRPKDAWRELTPGNAKSTLIDDDLVLSVLAARGVVISELVGAERLAFFGRRVTEDFGLPTPVPGKDDEWRVAAVARLLVTEATLRVPSDPPGERDRVIPAGPPRDQALRLLSQLKKNVELLPAFEDLSCRADATTSLVHWVRNVSAPVPPLTSRAAEDALFQREVDLLAKLEDFAPLARRLEEREPFFAAHAGGFWGSRAERRVPWQSLVSLARAASLLREQAGAEKSWKTPRDPVTWFTTVGWEVDRQGEVLFRDDAELSGGLHGVRARLRRAYLRHLDSSNAAFSELLHHHGLDALGLPFAGEVLAKERPAKDPMAVLVLDACRYDLGARLAEALNKGEPATRATVLSARAPLPSITALGMAFALADSADSLVVNITNDLPARWRVTASEFTGDLTAAESRREWLRRRFKLKPVATTDVKSVLDSRPPTPKEGGRLLFVFGDEFDTQGHEGELQFTGADDHIERYVRVVRRLRDAGYSTVAVVTDHGFIHWEPEKDEVDDPPTGEVLWKSRRAMVGRALKHPTAVAAPVTGSSLECCVPRSVNAFRTYGALGFFHGGATLQELVIPVVVFRWPKKAEKVSVLLTPLAEITSVAPRVEVRPVGQATLLATDAKMTGRQVLVKVTEPNTGRLLFQVPQKRSIKVDPDGSPVTFTLERVGSETCSRGARLQIEVRDADNDELLDRCDVDLKVDLEEWD